MSAKLLDGKAISDQILAELGPRVRAFTSKAGRAPLLSVISLGDDPAANLYTRRQLHLCSQIDIKTRVAKLGPSCTESDVIRTLEDLGRDAAVDGIMLETPLAPGLNLSRILNRMPAEKDVEGISPYNYGRLFDCKTFDEIRQQHLIIPPTAHAIIHLLLNYKIPLRGKNAVVVGRSNVVGKPAAHLLSALDATVTLCHSKTANLKKFLKDADIVVAALGKTQSIKAADLKKTAAVIDAGVNYKGKKILGDVDAKAAAKVKWLSPVPGGVGPVTTAMLLANAVLCAARRLSR